MSRFDSAVLLPGRHLSTAAVVGAVAARTRPLISATHFIKATPFAVTTSAVSTSSAGLSCLPPRRGMSHSTPLWARMKLVGSAPPQLTFAMLQGITHKIRAENTAKHRSLGFRLVARPLPFGSSAFRCLPPAIYTGQRPRPDKTFTANALTTAAVVFNLMALCQIPSGGHLLAY